MRYSFIITAVILITTYSQAQKLSSTSLSTLKSYMSGSFNSALQAKNDSDYYEIHLHMQPIWENTKDGFWLYVEQAISNALSKPYRQRIYHVSIKNDSTIVSKVYEIKSPLRFAGAFNNTELLRELTIDSLDERQGCAINLHWRNNNTFVGSTNQQDCASSLRGANYATSEVVISNSMMVSWDRGWDTNHKQVWGAVKAGYQFVKQRD